MKPDHDDHAADCGAQRRLTVAQINAELCRVLGITDLSGVASVTVELAPRAYPLVTIKRSLVRGRVLGSSTCRFRLVPNKTGAPEQPPSIPGVIEGVSR